MERLLNEPTAAALAYGIHQRGSETRFLVFDLGGGTFDVSVLDLFENVMEVRASAGDNYLGGEDFIQCLVERFFAHANLSPLFKRDPRFMQCLTAQLEAAKRRLSEAPQASVKVSAGNEEFSMDLDEAMLESSCEALLARLRAPVERALRDANLPFDQLDNIVLAGGATRMPMVRRLVARMFGRLPACGLNPDEVVALGAAVQAGLKMKDAALDEVVMTDVSPYSLGVGTSRLLGDGTRSHGHFDPIIERNTVVPVSRVRTYYPIHAEQNVVEIEVYQGEARMAKDNIRLGKLAIPIVPGAPEDNCVDVRFTYDANGLLQVEACLQRTGKTESLLIQGNPGMMSESEIASSLAALADLKIHPRERIENRTLLARGERLYQQLRGALREHLGQQIMDFEQMLSTQEKRQFEPAAKAFEQLLDLIEQQNYLHSDS